MLWRGIASISSIMKGMLKRTIIMRQNGMTGRLTLYIFVTTRSEVTINTLNGTPEKGLHDV